MMVILFWVLWFIGAACFFKCVSRLAQSVGLQFRPFGILTDLFRR